MGILGNFWRIPWKLTEETAAFESRNATSASDAAGPREMTRREWSMENKTVNLNTD
jgi:hypothetical protein